LDEGSNSITVSANGGFAFPAQMPGSATYDVSVGTQPLHQTCTVSNGIGQIPAQGSTPTVVDVDCVASQYFAYAAMYAGGNNSLEIYGYDLNASTGVPTPLPGSPFVDGISSQMAGAYPSGLAISPGANYVYATLDATGGFAEFTLNPLTGALTATAGNPILPAVMAKGSLHFTPNGDYAYAPDSGGGIDAFSVNASTGALTIISGSPFAGTVAASNLGQTTMAVSPDGAYLYAVDANANALFAYSINATTGALAPVSGSPFALPGGSFQTQSIILSPSGAYLYASEDPTYSSVTASGVVSAFSVNASTGALTLVTGSPFAATGTSALFCAISPDGAYLYASDPIPGPVVAAFSVSASTGALTPLAGSPFLLSLTTSNGTDLGRVHGIAVSPNGAYVYALEAFGWAVASVAPHTGVLTPISGSPFPDPSALATPSPLGLSFLTIAQP
jgi:6-phosphogluconolactonase (cycloisomerase 2 family)